MPGKSIHLSDYKTAFRGNVFQLGIVSFFTDFASEMIYPLLPVFFTGLVPVSVAAIYIGLMDGIAESTSSLLKIYAGRLSDKLGKRKSLALIGYTISSLARPFTALAGAGWHVIALRFFDRIGKGVRTSPRDALLSESVGPEIRGVAFSFHRLMDHTGAVMGPLVATGFLYAVLGQAMIWQQGNGVAGDAEMNAMRWLFAFAFIPGILAVLTIWFFVKDVPSPEKKEPAVSEKSTTPVEKYKLPKRFYIFLGSIVLFTLGNSSDLFLIFYAQTRYGLGLGWVIVLWVALHIAKIIFSLPGGWFSDRYGRRPAIIIGWLIYIGVYLAMPFAGGFWMTFALIAIYGIYYGMTEGAERALVADFVPCEVRGQAYGLYHGAIGFAALPASLLFGVFWAVLGATTAFVIGASLAFAALILLIVGLSTGKTNDTNSTNCNDSMCNPASRL